jgi:hypothetical protein
MMKYAMGTLYPAKQESDQIAPQATVTLMPGDFPVVLNCALWPLKESDFHWDTEIPLNAVLSSFIEDSIIPDGTATLDQRHEALMGLARVQKELNAAVAKLKSVPLRPQSTKSEAEAEAPARSMNGWHMAQEIDALYEANPMAIGSAEMREQIQLRLQEAFTNMQQKLAAEAAAAAEPSRKVWGNGCDTQVPRALRYLAENDRPGGGAQSFNSEHLYQLAGEIEDAVKTTVKLGLSAVNEQRD